MSVARWSISGLDDRHIWTPAEVAQIARAAQAFQAALPSGGLGKIMHIVRLDGIDLVPSDIKVDWPQPGTPEAHEHVYKSTSCQHDQHQDCQTDATRYDGTEKVAGQCKYCAAPCICLCHEVCRKEAEGS